MTAIPSDKLDKVLQRWEYLQYELSQRVNQTNYAQLSKEFSDLGPLVETIRALRQTEAERSDLTAMLNDPAADKELAAMARDELATLGPRVSALEQELRLQLLPKDSADEKSAILEVRAGTGGDEAALFAADLFRMYSRYADIHGWKTEIISLSENDLGGYKEMVASITGKGVFARLKFESGVHRVQRVPATEASGRIHTSTATVAVDVWMRPLASVAGTRCTRCTPLSYFSWLYTRFPSIDAMASLMPPMPVSLKVITSIFQPWRSAKRLYMRNSSPAKSAASSPPVPARISSRTFFSSFGSLGSSRTFSSPWSASSFGSSSLSSSFASAAMSASPDWISSRDPSACAATRLYSRYLSTTGSSSDSALACSRYFVASLWTAGFASRTDSSS